MAGVRQNLHEGININGTNSVISDVIVQNVVSDGIDSDLGNNIRLERIEVKNCGGRGLNITQQAGNQIDNIFINSQSIII